MCLCREFTDPCGRCLNIFPFQKPGSRLCHFHLCVAEGIFANAAEVAATSQCDAASLHTPLLFRGRTGVSFVSFQALSTPSEREERIGCFQRPPKAPSGTGAAPGGLPGPQAVLSHGLKSSPLQKHLPSALTTVPWSFLRTGLCPIHLCPRHPAQHPAQGQITFTKLNYLLVASGSTPASERLLCL